MTDTRTLVIVGGSLAGAKAAESARSAGYDGRVVLVDEETANPYERPPLSKGILRGEADAETARVHSEDFYAEHGIEVIVDRATVLEPVSRHIELAGGDVVSFDTAVLATGASPRRYLGPGADLDGIHYLRTIDDSLRLRDAVKTATRVAVVGAGWVGSEVAASARQMGADVVLIEPGPFPLHRILGGELGEVFRDLHVSHGVELRLGSSVVELRGGKHVEAVVLDDGRVELADVVVMGIGAVPNTALAEHAIGLRVDNGIAVDSHLQTNVAGIYAAGDVANAWHPFFDRPLRVEHWANALNQGVTAGRNAVGNDDVYDRLPYFFSDQYDLGLEYVGHHHGGETLTVRGALDDRKFIAFWHDDGVVTAALAVNVWDVMDDLKRLITSRTNVGILRLRDIDVPVADLVPRESE